MRVYAYAEAIQKIAFLLEEVFQQGEVRIRMAVLCVFASLR